MTNEFYNKALDVIAEIRSKGSGRVIGEQDYIDKECVDILHNFIISIGVLNGKKDTEDEVFKWIACDKREEFLRNLLDIQRAARILSIDLNEVVISNYYANKEIIDEAKSLVDLKIIGVTVKYK